MKKNTHLRKVSRGFSFAELLVTITIVVIMFALASGGYNRVLQQANATQEVAAARNLIGAYTTASSETGEFLSGYDVTGLAQTSNGDPISFPASARYPWRLAPYFNYDFGSTVLVSNNQSEVEQAESYEYTVSLAPSFGINAYCVGGYDDSSSNILAEPVKKLFQPKKPGSLIVFASAHTKNADDTHLEGNHIITPPNIGSATWSVDDITDTSNHSDSGNVHFRHNNKAVVAFLDGHIEQLRPDQMRDMRLWSNSAMIADDPNFVISRKSASSLRQRR